MIKRILTILALTVSLASNAQLSVISSAANNFLTTRPVPLTIADNYELRWIVGMCDTVTANYYTGHQVDSLIATVHFDTTAIYTQLNARVKYSDTSAILTPYMRKSDTVSLSNRINNKLSIADTSTMLSPYQRSAFAIIKGGQAGGGTLTYGASDSSTIQQVLVGAICDSISRTNGTHYMINNKGGTNGENILILKNRQTYGGIYQTSSLMFGLGTGNSVSTNLPYIGWGPSLGSLNQLLAYGQLQTASMRLTAITSTNTPMTIYGAGSTTTSNISAVQFGLGTWNGNGPNVPTSGILNVIGSGATSGTSGTFAPTSGTAEKYAYNDIGVINQSGSATGVTASFTNRSVTLTGAYDYKGVYLTNNTGWGVFSSGTAPSAFSGAVTIGSTTNDGVNKLRVVGDVSIDGAIKVVTGSNKAVGTATLSSGTVTVSNTLITVNSIITLTPQNCVSCGTPYISAKVAGTSFTITSTNASDGSTIGYTIFN